MMRRSVLRDNGISGVSSFIVLFMGSIVRNNS